MAYCARSQCIIIIIYVVMKTQVYIQDNDWHAFTYPCTKNKPLYYKPCMSVYHCQYVAKESLEEELTHDLP